MLRIRSYLARSQLNWGVIRLPCFHDMRVATMGSAAHRVVALTEPGHPSNPLPNER